MSDRRSDAFQRALDEAGRKDRAPNDSGAGPTGGARVRGVAFGPAPGSGGKARFGLALDWTDEPVDARPRRRNLRRANRLGVPAIRRPRSRAELGLGAALTLDQLTSRWRDFVWRNHPDRQPADARERANARVAIANTLYDRSAAGASPRRDSRPRKLSRAAGCGSPSVE